MKKSNISSILGKSSNSACPYATKLLVKDKNNDQTDNDDHTNDETLTAIELAKKSCPAFKNNQTSTSTCPFRSVNNASQFKKAMLSIPPSHYETATTTTSSSSPDDNKMDIPKQFRLALEHMHEVSQTLNKDNTDNGFTLDGGCPFKSYYKSEANEEESVPFIAALEGFSLNAIMAAMATTNNNEDDNHDDQVMTTKTETTDPSQERRDSLSKALKTGTAASHKAAENVHFVRNFIKMKVRLDLYKQMVVGLYFTYKALEHQLDVHGPTHFPSLYVPDKLSRTESLKLDLLYFYGSNWENEMPKPSLAIQDYIDRINHIAQTDPILLLSHAYTRYLGDLSGGRVLARIAKKALALPEESLNFYNFENIQNAKEFKNYYRYQLDQLILRQDKIACMVQEANVAFVLNMRMFEELDVMSADVPNAKVRPLHEALSFRAHDDNHDGKNKECPFAAMAREAKNNNNSKMEVSSSQHRQCPMKQLEINFIGATGADGFYSIFRYALYAVLISFVSVAMLN